MSHSRRWLVALLSLVVLVLIGINLANYDHSDTAHNTVTQPAYQSEQTQTLVYSPQGLLSYRLTAQQVRYNSDSETSWFSQPVMLIYDGNKQPAWRVQADNAQLTKDRQLYLQGHVQLSALTAEAQLRKIYTNSARVNLASQDIASDERVTLYGSGLYSTGLKMRGNLREKTAQLIEQVKTSYETQNQQTPH